MMGIRTILRIPERFEGYEPGWWLFFSPFDGSETLEWGPFQSLAEAEEFRDRTVH